MEMLFPPTFSYRSAFNEWVPTGRSWPEGLMALDSDGVAFPQERVEIELKA